MSYIGLHRDPRAHRNGMHCLKAPLSLAWITGVAGIKREDEREKKARGCLYCTYDDTDDTNTVSRLQNIARLNPGAGPDFSPGSTQFHATL